MATDEQFQSDATTLCKACGLCCTGHLFAWAKLKSTEMKSAQALGLNVLGSDPKSRGFSQPCPLWDGECTIHSSPQYPHYCGLYKCKLLKKVMDESVALPDALTIVQETKELILELESLLPATSNGNFRERLIHAIEHESENIELQQKAHVLLLLYKNQFGVKDLIDNLDQQHISIDRV